MAYLQITSMEKSGLQTFRREHIANSISNQKKMLEDYARRNGLPNPTHFTDDGVSGTRFDRPGFLAMMEEVEAGRVEATVNRYLEAAERPERLDLRSYER